MGRGWLGERFLLPTWSAVFSYPLSVVGYRLSGVSADCRLSLLLVVFYCLLSVVGCIMLTRYFRVSLSVVVVSS